MHGHLNVNLSRCMVTWTSKFQTNCHTNQTLYNWVGAGCECLQTLYLPHQQESFVLNNYLFTDWLWKRKHCDPGDCANDAPSSTVTLGTVPTTYLAALWHWGLFQRRTRQHCDPGDCTNDAPGSAVTLGTVPTTQPAALWHWGLCQRCTR